MDDNFEDLISFLAHIQGFDGKNISLNDKSFHKDEVILEPTKDAAIIRSDIEAGKRGKPISTPAPTNDAEKKERTQKVIDAFAKDIFRRVTKQ